MAAKVFTLLKIKQNIDKYRTELTPENDQENEDAPATSTVI